MSPQRWQRGGRTLPSETLKWEALKLAIRWEWDRKREDPYIYLYVASACFDESLSGTSREA